jgi:hypothetical protein
MPTTMFPIGYASHLLAEPDIEAGHNEEQQHDTDVKSIRHMSLSRFVSAISATPKPPQLHTSCVIKRSSRLVKTPLKSGCPTTQARALEFGK